MHLNGSKLWLSAGDLGNHLACLHLTNLNHRRALGLLRAPRKYRSEEDELAALQERGQEHEAAYIEHLREGNPGLVVADLSGERSMGATVEAMRGGADLIVQAWLEGGRWMGVADILRRVDAASGLGGWSYEVVDTKLAQETRAASVLQICLYSELVGDAQGKAPERMFIVAPNRQEGKRFREERYRVNDYSAYYRLVRRLLEETVEAGAEGTDTYPEPVERCDICAWRLECSIRRRADDHLSLVADLGGRHMREAKRWGIETLTGMASEPLPLQREVRHGSAKPYERAREQARVQLEGRKRNEPYFEALDQEPPVESVEGLRAPSPLAGLWRLPEPSPGDVFFDIEGDAFVWPSGFEYLFGWVVVDGEGKPEYRSGWAFGVETDPAGFASGEKALFERFVDEVMARREAWPGMHIYHFAPYEPSALKRLMSRYATREEEVDVLLREERFVDLHSALRKSVVASVERYSIKDMEAFFGYERRVGLHTANDARHGMERLLEAGRPDAVTEEMRGAVEEYNRDDCESTLRLRDWLEGIRSEQIAGGVQLWRPEREMEALEEREPSELQQRTSEAQGLLLEGVPADAADRTREEQARWLLAHLLGWHRREEKSKWWGFFALGGMDDEELMRSRDGLAGLRHESRREMGRALPIDRYTFPLQETAIGAGDSLYVGASDAHGDSQRPFGGAVAAGDGWVEVKKRKDTLDSHPASVFRFDKVDTRAQLESLLRLAEWVVENGVDAPGDYRAARDLLLARAPRLASAAAPGAPLAREGESTPAAARRLVLELEGGVLAAQGPPGSGKTFTGARMICDLVRAGKKVGVTSNSHQVILNLLEAVVSAAAAEGAEARCVRRTAGGTDSEEREGIRTLREYQAILSELEDGRVNVVGGTGWMWAREDFIGAVDALFVDEAGQMSLASVLAMAPAARNVVLLGDPQQLEQPSQASHPDGVGASALEHLLRDYEEETRQTIPRDRGLFLERTWRLPAGLCGFTSEQFYEGRLEPEGAVAGQRLTGKGSFLGTGLWFSGVEHEGNQNSSPEEASRVREIYERLLEGGTSWVDRWGEERPLAEKDVMIVAPYNAQLALIRRELPEGARVGTVDKFQGQESPVVVYSMASSSAEEAPRGMEFLYSLNRLNVATSRAQCVSIIVASPRLFEPECKSPRQMLLANALCRYRELAQELPALRGGGGQ